MRGTIRLITAALITAPLIASPLAAQAPPGGTRLAIVAWHDVVDDRDERRDDSVTSQSLVETFDWLKADGWTPVSADAVLAAGRGGPPLPPKAILLTFDDGYRSFYERVYPLLLAYGYPAVVAPVGAWMEVPPGGTVDYGGTPVPRAKFVTWDMLRRMQASGLVEVASHSHDLHRVVPSTAEGNTAPAARTWAFDPLTGRRETDAEHRARLRADHRRVRELFARELGRPLRIHVWPFGRFSGPALEEAKAAGFEMLLTLEPEMADARRPDQLPRYYPTGDPGLGVLAWNLGFPLRRAETRRYACLDPAPLATGTAAEQDAALGAMIEAVRKLGATDLVLDAARRPVPGAPLVAAWLPTAGLPLAADIFGRAARQLSVRSGVSVHARIPLAATVSALGEAGAAAFAADVARMAPIDGLVIEGAGAAAAPPTPPTPADIRAARTPPESAAQRIFAAASAVDPRLRLLLAVPGGEGPPPGAEAALAAPPPDPAALAAAGWLVPAHSGRAALPVASAERREIARLQRAGATALALCPFDPADAGRLAPAFSAATFPWRP